MAVNYIVKHEWLITKYNSCRFYNDDNGQIKTGFIL